MDTTLEIMLISYFAGIAYKCNIWVQFYIQIAIKIGCKSKEPTQKNYSSHLCFVYWNWIAYLNFLSDVGFFRLSLLSMAFTTKCFIAGITNAVTTLISMLFSAFFKVNWYCSFYRRHIEHQVKSRMVTRKITVFILLCAVLQLLWGLQPQALQQQQ